MRLPPRPPSGPQRLALAEHHDGLLWAALLSGAARHGEAGLRPDLRERITSLAAPRAEGWAPPAPDWAEEAEPTRHGYTLIENVALIEASGLLMARGFFSWWSETWQPGYRDLVAALRAAQEDERVAAVLFRFDTPGGLVAGSIEAAQAMRALTAAEGGKPVIGHVGELCCSAGQLLAAQCDAFYGETAATVGSIGVRLAFYDVAGAMERFGERAHTYVSGRLKDIGSPLRAPTEEESRLFQSEVDWLADRFFIEVAAGRGLDIAALRASRGFEAATFLVGEDAPAELNAMRTDVDLVDGILTESEAFDAARRLTGAPAPVPAPAAVSRAATGAAESPSPASKETPMKLTARIAGLRTLAAKGDAKAQAELEELKAVLMTEDEAETEDEDADAETEEDDAEAATEDESDAEYEDDEAESEDEDEEAEASATGQKAADRLLASPAAKARPVLAGRLAVRVATGALSLGDALGDLQAAGRETSGFRRAARENTPDGVRGGGGSPGGGQSSARTALGDAMKRRARRG